MQTGLLVLGTMVLVTGSVPAVLPVLLPLGVVFSRIHRRYVATSRELKRWEAVTRCVRPQWGRRSWGWAGRVGWAGLGGPSAQLGEDAAQRAGGAAGV